MLKPRLFVVTCLVLAGSAFTHAQAAEKVIGITADVKGLVTVSDGVHVSSVTDGSPVMNGTRYVTGSIGSVTLRFGQCAIQLKPNQSLLVEELKLCDALIASVESLIAPTASMRGPLLATSIVSAGLLAVRGGGQTPVNPNLSGQ
jgi:hypothetical protein